ncbi:MAG TPA: hypothetical protein VGQ89_17985 [Candidatus Limnocylindrales bacterium]|jgi:hypothetical protein|nr:hypothetical protein [Candidatus Limnocylindrales bacterium]
MSRRHHGRPHHGRHRNDPQRVDQATRQAPPFAIDPANVQETRAAEPGPGDAAAAEPKSEPVTAQIPPTSAPIPPTAATPTAPMNGHATNGEMAPRPTNGTAAGRDERPNGCTAPQLRRFIKSRPYVPMHELRRRFAIDGNDDDVTQVRLEDGHVYVGLPQREGSLLGELLRGGEIGYELSFDPRAPIVVGVYPMRPVPRP